MISQDKNTVCFSCQESLFQQLSWQSPSEFFLNRLFLNSGCEQNTVNTKSRNWDKFVRDVTEMEKNEKPEGDAALNHLFQQIYADGSDDVKRAMVKSFVSYTFYLFATRKICQVIPGENCILLLRF